MTSLYYIKMYSLRIDPLSEPHQIIISSISNYSVSQILAESGSGFALQLWRRARFMLILILEEGFGDAC